MAGVSAGLVMAAAAGVVRRRLSHGERSAVAASGMAIFALRIPPRTSRFVGVKTSKNKKGSRDKISQPLEKYGRDGVIRTLDP